MEGGDHRLGNRAAPGYFRNALGHLGCGFVGERDRKNRLGHGPEVLDQVRNAVGNDTRLAAARARKNQDRAVGGLDRLPLLRVEL